MKDKNKQLQKAEKRDSPYLYALTSMPLRYRGKGKGYRGKGIEVRIRELGPDDAEAYKALRLKALSEHPEAFGQSLEEAQQQTIEEIRREIVGWRSAGGFALVALDEVGCISGMVAVGRSKFEKMRHRGHVWGVYVDPLTRGQGVATKLFESLIARASNSLPLCL